MSTPVEEGKLRGLSVKERARLHDVWGLTEHVKDDHVVVIFCGSEGEVFYCHSCQQNLEMGDSKLREVLRDALVDAYQGRNIEHGPAVNMRELDALTQDVRRIIDVELRRAWTDKREEAWPRGANSPYSVGYGDGWDGARSNVTMPRKPLKAGRPIP